MRVSGSSGDLTFGTRRTNSLWTTGTAPLSDRCNRVQWVGNQFFRCICNRGIVEWVDAIAIEQSAFFLVGRCNLHFFLWSCAIVSASIIRGSLCNCLHNADTTYLHKVQTTTLQTTTLRGPHFYSLQHSTFVVHTTSAMQTIFPVRSFGFVSCLVL